MQINYSKNMDWRENISWTKKLLRDSKDIIFK